MKMSTINKEINLSSNESLTTDNDTSTNLLYNATILVNSTNRTIQNTDSVFESKIIIPLYVVIFLLAIIGNFLVLVTLVQNKRMRTVTNVYLMNLAVSDLLLGVFCMPFTLVGQVLRNFIFGAAMCKLIPYFQAVSVSVGVWTLVAISLERYFAICRPLKSRRWQTQFHAYKMIGMVWLASLSWSAPVLVVSSLKAMKGRGHKCREEWPSKSSERVFNLFLDAMLLLVPMIIMSLAYSLIMSKLWKGLRREIKHNNSCQRQTFDTLGKDEPSPSSLRKQRLNPGSFKTRNRSESVKLWLMKGMVQVGMPNPIGRDYGEYTTGRNRGTFVSRCELPTEHCPANGHCTDEDNLTRLDETTYTFTRHAIRSNYMDKSIEAKRKVIRMLFVVVAEFFICWAPLHLLNTWYLFCPDDVYKYVGSTGISLVQLLAYISSCCNPITYCFMNRKFRQAFLAIFNWYSVCCCCFCVTPESARLGVRTGNQLNGIHKIIQNNSDISCNDSTAYMVRASGRCSEVVVLEAEDRV